MPALESGSMESDEFEVDSKEEVATKLALARSYMDMQAHSLASEVLHEVLLVGDWSAKQEASSLLREIHPDDKVE